APAPAWEAELLPARLRDYAPAWLDDLCSGGRTPWTRLRAAGNPAQGNRAGPSPRHTPVPPLPRPHLGPWAALAPPLDPGLPGLSSRARKVADCLATHGASFFDELLDATGLLRTELEDALAELVARGMAHCDSFAGLRALLVPPSKRPSPGRGRRRAAFGGVADAGRWALVRRPAPHEEAGATARRRPDAEAVEHVARVLLRRYGVVGWRILEREAAWLPPWRELLRVYHRLEARGEVRGGRFIEGLSGEQFALPEAIAPLRRMRNRPLDG